MSRLFSSRAVFLTLLAFCVALGGCKRGLSGHYEPSPPDAPDSLISRPSFEFRDSVVLVRHRGNGGNAIEYEYRRLGDSVEVIIPNGNSREVWTLKLNGITLESQGQIWKRIGN